MKTINYSFSDDTFTIVVPSKPEDLSKEGASLHHCVGSYISRVANGENLIIFCRKKDVPEEPLLTIDIKDNRINQVEGLCRRNPNVIEKEFIHKFATKHNLSIERI